MLNLQGLPTSAFIQFFPIPGDVQIGHPEVAAQSVSIPLLDPKATPKQIDGVVVINKNREMEDRAATGPQADTQAAGPTTAVTVMLVELKFRPVRQPPRAPPMARLAPAASRR